MGIHNKDGRMELKTLGDEELKVLDKFIKAPMLLFNDEEILFLNDSCLEVLGYGKDDLSHDKSMKLMELVADNSIQFINFAISSNKSPIKEEITMYNKHGEKVQLLLLGEVVIYNSQKCILANLKDVSYSRRLESYIRRISELRSLMLEITRLALEVEDINKLLQLILEIALKSIENGTVGSIMIKKGDYFVVGSHAGFSDDIVDFKLPVQDAFLYRATKGKMDKIANIPDLRSYSNYYPIKTKYGEEKYIKSTLTAPIYIKEKLFGMINIDCIETNSFDEDDIKTMEFIRNYIEIIISNYLLFEEKTYLAQYDQLTKVYNRSCFEEHFKMVLQNSLCCKESFNLVLLDINDLKVVNDSYGHLIGDEVIKGFAQKLKKNIRKTDIIGRLGGDEFIGIFFNTNKQDLDKKFQNFLEKLEQENLIIEGNRIKCSFSYGIATFPQDGTSFKELVKVADYRMYLFKERYKAKNRLKV